MALKIEKADSEGYESKGRLAPLVPREESIETVYLLLLLDRWKLIAAITLLSIIGTFILSKTWMTKWYRATAVIEPIPEGAVEDRVEGGVGAFGGGGVATLLMSGGTDAQAQEYMTILRSFAFNTDLALKHELRADLLDKDSEKPKNERDLRMKLFDALTGRFKVEYSIQSHNMSVRFIDRDPIVAQRILQYYLDELRELQRREAIKNASAAIESLEKEAKTTADSLLAQNLYSLVAKQVQRQKLAEVEADFAFKVLEAPISPDRPYSPSARLDCFVAMVLTPMIVSAFILFFGMRERRPR